MALQAIRRKKIADRVPRDTQAMARFTGLRNPWPEPHPRIAEPGQVGITAS
jgi:hypothetical protein